MSTPVYSPHARTALVLVGTGTAGAYHAGVLRALHEAGVRIDIVAGRGVGAAGAVFAAVDAGTKLWEPDGLWASPDVAKLYPWRPLWRALVWGVGLAALALLLPLAIVTALGLTYPLVLVAQLIAPAAARVLTDVFANATAFVVSPELLGSLVPRLATLALLIVSVILVVVWVLGRRGLQGRRRVRGGAWWRALGAPLDAASAADYFAGGFWQFIRGAANIAQPGPADLSRRYSDLLGESLGQPGYRELIVTVHDLDVHRDLVFALLAEPWQRAFGGDASVPEGQRRQAELIDLSALGGDHVVDALAGALAVPVVAQPRAMTFSPESYWRGETHRLCDRPAATTRLIEEVWAAGATQVIVASASADVPGPHALSAPRLDPKARFGEWVASTESSALRDGLTAHRARFDAAFEIAPAHNPLGPFDVSGGYDQRSDRMWSLRELMARGYEDAYRQFIEPIVGAGAEQPARVSPQRATPSIDELELRPRP